MLDPGDVVRALAPVAQTLQSLGIRFYVGGSVASPFHGAARSTMDVDIVCEIDESDVSSFLRGIGDDYSDLLQRLLKP